MQDRYFDSLLQFQLDALNFRPWGFEKLQLDHEKLTSGNLAITAASGILPDGLVFDIPVCDATPPAKPLAGAFEEGQDTIDVFLTIPVNQERGLNIALGQGDGNTRFGTQTIALRDENTGVTERPIQLTKKNLRFLVASELREGTTALRVARVKRTEAGIYQADPHFIPALVNFGANEYLISIVRRLVEILAAKSTQLSDAKRQKNQSLASFTASEIPNFWLLYTVNAYFPLLNHFFQTNKGHPERVFAAMLDIASALTTFSTELQPTDFPRYDHDDLSFCFSDLDKKLRRLLDSVVPNNFVALPLKLGRPSIYSTSLAEDKYFKKTTMYLALSADLSQADLISKAPQLIKVGSISFVDHLVRKALIGLPLTHVASPESIPVKLKYQYFALEQSGPAWDVIVRERNMAAYVPGELLNPQLELIVVFT
jgi:type VI secretion system protein ImpJ